MIRIAIVDHHPVARSGLKAFLSEQPDFCVAAEATDGEGIVGLVKEHNVDVLILDMTMPNFNGIDVLASVSANAPSIGILMFSSLPEENFASSMLHKGALGYLTKACPAQQIPDAIRAIANGQQYISPALRDAQKHHLLTAIDGYPHENLNARELQVFIRLAKGESSAVISDALQVSEKTVAKHRKNTLLKLGLETDQDLKYYAAKYDLID